MDMCITHSYIIPFYCIELILFWPTYFTHSAIMAIMFKTASHTVCADGQYAHQKGANTKNLSNKHSMLHKLSVSCLTHRVHGCGGTILSMRGGWGLPNWSSPMCVCTRGTFFSRQCTKFIRSLILRSMMSKYNITLYAVTCTLSPVVEVEPSVWVWNLVSSPTSWNYDTYYQVHEWEEETVKGTDYVSSCTVIVRVGCELKCSSGYSTAVPAV